MKKYRRSVICYSNEKGKDLLELCEGQIDGAKVNSCHPYWHRGCVSQGQCRNFFSEGTIWRDIKLANLLKKSVSKLTDNDRYDKANKFKEKAFRQCKKIKVTVEY